ncbi:IucA/IucC family protein [Kitasatospora mediocidica]|uniref:IucA/IucC family protein n=1 Tax=Kitasatospora mediocidica TaxID=58352 RepID=UPI00068A4AE1|nr:IucA/IucC family protein [Kitasatospora mediocidica]
MASATKDRARTAVATKLAEALWREDVGDARRRYHGQVHAFDRVVLPPVEADPASLTSDPGLRAELASAVTGLSLAYTRRSAADLQCRASGYDDMISLAQSLGPDAGAARLEQLATDGHNLHPCARTRLGWDVEDMVKHDLETPFTQVRALWVPTREALGDDLSERLGLPVRPGYAALPVHAWQHDHLLRSQPDLAPADFEARAVPTAALRTVLLDDGTYLKLSLDVQITSTRRTVSIASTRNGPVLSAWIRHLIEEEPIVLMAETASAASTRGDGRAMSTIVREGLGGRLLPDEVPVPAVALTVPDPITGQPVFEGLLRRSGQPPMEFFRRYARLLLGPALRLAARHGIGLEAHLQNCVPTFVDGRPHRMGLRDLAGMRVLTSQSPDLWPGSVIGTSSREVMLSKVAYTTFQAHLGELVLRMALEPDPAWAAVREIVDDVLQGHPDHGFFTAPTLPHKALIRMRLAGRGDVYVKVRNALHG